MIAKIDTSNALEGSLGFTGNGNIVSTLRQTETIATTGNFVMTDPNHAGRISVRIDLATAG